MEKQPEIISRQQRYLEVLDKEEQENNIVLLGFPDDQESLDRTTSDAAKVERVFEKVEADVGAIRAVRRLGSGK